MNTVSYFKSTDFPFTIQMSMSTPHEGGIVRHSMLMPPKACSGRIALNLNCASFFKFHFRFSHRTNLLQFYYKLMIYLRLLYKPRLVKKTKQKDPSSAELQGVKHQLRFRLQRTSYFCCLREWVTIICLIYDYICKHLFLKCYIFVTYIK